MSHEHKEYFYDNMRGMCRVRVDRKLNGRDTQTTVLNGEGLRVWFVVINNVEGNLFFMGYDALSNRTGMSKENVCKRLAVFVEAGWLIERGFEKHGKYAATKTYEVVLDVLGVGHMTHPQRESRSTSHGASNGRSKGESRGESRNIANTTQEGEMPSNPIPNRNPTPTPNAATHESANNIDNTPSTEAWEMQTRIDNIITLCIELERNKTPNIGRGLQVILHRDYSTLAYEELKSREWLTDGQTADVCYAKRNGKTPPCYTRPACRACGGKNTDIEGLEGLSTVWAGNGTYVLCPKCDGDGFQPLKDFTRTLFTNLNTKGNTK
jgi:hypothetical protein